jgi:hypothetical protein
MTWVGERWSLRRGDELVGTITVEDQDFPWLLVAHFLLHIEGDKAWFRWSND